MRERKKILIIDDEEEFCLVACDFLKLRGFETEYATNPDRGIKIAKNTCPDLILLDVKMPKKDGFEVLGTLKSDPRTMSIPVVMLTALDADEQRIKASSSYSEDYITKPVSYEKLVARITEILNKTSSS